MPVAARGWAAREAGAPVRSVVRLPGASSSAVHLLRFADGATLVLRRYAWPGFRAAEPAAAGREVDALRHAAAHGLPVPEVVAADPSGGEVGDGVPVLLMTRVPGRPVVNPDPAALAGTAAQIHDTDATGFPHTYFPWYTDTMRSPPQSARRPRVWERAIDLWHRAAPDDRPAFVHRDFHPGNVLWRRHRVSGVVDWANACRGPRGCDLAHCCANLADLAGAPAAGEFLAAYTALTGEGCHPYWMLARILEGGGTSSWTPREVARQEPALARLVAELS